MYRAQERYRLGGTCTAFSSAVFYFSLHYFIINEIETKLSINLRNFYIAYCSNNLYLSIDTELILFSLQNYYFNVNNRREE